MNYSDQCDFKLFVLGKVAGACWQTWKSFWAGSWKKNSDYAAQLYLDLQFSSSSTKFKWSPREKWVTAAAAAAAAEKIKHQPEKQFPRTLFSFYKQVRGSAAEFNAHHFLASTSRPSSSRVLATPPVESTRSSGFMKNWHLTFWKETLTWLDEQLELLKSQGWDINGAALERSHMDQFRQSEGLKPKGAVLQMKLSLCWNKKMLLHQQ